MKRAILAAAFVCIAAAPGAQAQFYGGDTAVNGSVDLHVVSGGGSTMIATGAATAADNFLASVTEGSKVGGSVSASVATGGDVTIAAGWGARARNYEATVDAGHVGGNVSLHAYTGGVVTGAFGVGAQACTSVASIHRSTSGGFNSTVATGGIVNVGLGTWWPGQVVIGSLGRPC